MNDNNWNLGIVDINIHSNDVAPDLSSRFLDFENNDWNFVERIFGVTSMILIT